MFLYTHFLSVYLGSIYFSVTENTDIIFPVQIIFLSMSMTLMELRGHYYSSSSAWEAERAHFLYTEGVEIFRLLFNFDKELLNPL